MKHILNDISLEEKKRILEQHDGGKKLVIENFNKLVNNKLGTVKTLVSEQESTPVIFDKNYFMNKKTGTATFDFYGFPVSVDGVEITDYETQWKNNFSRNNMGGRGFKEGDYNYEYSETASTGVMSPDKTQSNQPGVVFKDSSGNEVGSVIF